MFLKRLLIFSLSAFASIPALSETVYQNCKVTNITIGIHVLIRSTCSSSERYVIEATLKEDINSATIMPLLMDSLKTSTPLEILLEKEGGTKKAGDKFIISGKILGVSISRENKASK